MNKKILQIALYDKKILKSIFEVKNGNDCNCFCPKCGGELSAKNNNKTENKPLELNQNIAHFAHQNGSDCPGSYESSIHKLAKTVIEKTKKLLLPPIYKNSVQLTKKQLVCFEKVETEKNINTEYFKIIPDVILHIRGEKLLVEFYKTHKVDNLKTKKIHELNENCIEVNLNDINPIDNGKVNFKGMTEFLENSILSKEWIYYKKTEELYSKRLKEKKNKEQLQKQQNELNLTNERKIKEAKENRINNWKLGLIEKGFEFLKISEFIKYDYDSYYNENTGYSKTYKTVDYREENVFCPKEKVNGKNKRIDIIDCNICEFYKSKIYSDYGINFIACGFKKKLTK